MIRRLRRAVRAPMLDAALAYAYAPVAPLMKRIKIERRGRRRPRADHILLPEGYAAEVVAVGLTTPVHCTFDDRGGCYVSECGHKVENPPRIVRIDLDSGERRVVFDLPQERWVKTGAFTGAAWHEGSLYFTNTHTLSRIRSDGPVEDLVTDLPGLGDHQTNHPVVGPDGRLYFGQGTVTNAGVVGADNFAYEWLPQHPTVCDVPGADVTLAGRNYEFRDVLGSLTDTVRTGAYVPFGTETKPGEVIRGDVRCNGAILRCRLDGGGLEVVAWGLRNPYGLAFHPDGRLFATEHGMDERGARYVVGDPDDLYEIREGVWYGWPDFAAGIRLDDPRWTGRGREPVLEEPPDPHPPEPFATFEPHAGANGLDFCRDASFGFPGDAFVALFGDLSPVTARPSTPVGFKVVRVDMRAGTVSDFAVNRVAGPASRLPHEGFERPSHCAFGPDGALYVVDWGVIRYAPEVGGVRMVEGTGVLWRIRRTAGPPGTAPPSPVVLPLNAARRVAVGAGAAVLLGAALRRAVRSLLRRRGRPRR